MSCSCKGTMPVGKGYGNGVATGNGGEKLFTSGGSKGSKLTVTKKVAKKATRMTFTKK